MKTLLMFVDESFNDEKCYYQISGIIITPSNYIKLREEVLRHLYSRFKNTQGGYTKGDQACYHSNNFCPELNDADKIIEWSFLLGKIYTYSMDVFIHGMHATKSFSDVVQKSKVGYLNMVWHYQLRYLKSYGKTNFIIPIIDLGLNKSFEYWYKMYSDSHKTSTAIITNACGLESHIDVLWNVLEPVFCKDEYSIGVQMADLIGAFQWTNSKLYPDVAESCFKSSAAIIFRKYIMRKRTSCLFYTMSLLQMSHSDIRYHDSFRAGKPVLNDMSE